jgi:hypothetical protein
MHSPILAPIVALVGWTIVMLLWGLVARGGEMKRVGIDLMTQRGSTPGNMDGVLAATAQWKMHNYNHLTEQPTLFYAICLVIALTGTGGGFNAALAWTYVGLRIVHSLVQSTSNIIRYRVALFVLSTLVLIMLTFHAALALYLQ